MEKKNDFYLGNSTNNVLGKSIKKQKYQMNKVDLSFKNDSHSIIINRILKGNKKGDVLDIGCNTGAIGDCLSTRDYNVDGIEYDKDFFDILKEKNIYKNMYNMSICDFNSKQFKDFYNDKKKYDYIIFADVLEHLTNPDEVIFKLTSKLKKDGKILISIPNIAHCDIISELFNFNFNYNDEGILDSTHLRFFTNNSFIEMINNIEEKNNIYYNVNKIGNTYVTPLYYNKNHEVLFNLISNIEDYSIIQNIYEISVSNKKQKRNIKESNNYELLCDKVVELINQNEELSKKNSELEEKYNGIINSKRFKFINSVANFFRK